MSQCYCEDCQEIDYCHSSQIKGLEEENQKLKETLQRIVEKGPASPGDKKHEMAKEALQSKDTSDYIHFSYLP